MTALPSGVVVVGTGSIGRRHLGNLLALGVTNVVACSEHHRHATIDIGGIEVACVDSYDEALAGPQPVVVIANPSSMHADYATRALAAGKHVLVEKPVCIELDSLTALRATADRSPATVGVVQQFRFHPTVAALQTHLRAGTIGDAVVVEARQGEHLADYHPGEDYTTSYAARRELGGGILLTQIHLLDLVCFLFGSLDGVHGIVESIGLLGLDVDESASFLGRTATGAHLYGHVDFHTRPRRFQIDVVGSDGRITADLVTGTIEVRAADGRVVEQTSTPPDRDAMFRAVLVDFFEAIEQHRAPACSLADAALPLALIDELRHATTGAHPS